MPYPTAGSHVGHLIQGGRCEDCARYLDRADFLEFTCPACSARPGAGCDRSDLAPGYRDRYTSQGRPLPVHQERMWLAQGHPLEALPALREQSGAARERGTKARDKTDSAGVGRDQRGAPAEETELQTARNGERRAARGLRPSAPHAPAGPGRQAAP